MHERQCGAVEHVGADATIDDALAVAQCPASKTGSASASASRLASVTGSARPTISAACSPNAAVQSARLELPVRKVRLHDLESGRDPLDRAQHVRVRPSVTGTGPARPNTTSGSMRGSTMRASDRSRDAIGRVLHRLAPRMRPHRLIDAVAWPDRAVGETDLATDRLPPVTRRDAARSRAARRRQRQVELRHPAGDRARANCRRACAASSASATAAESRRASPHEAEAVRSSTVSASHTAGRRRPCRRRPRPARPPTPLQPSDATTAQPVMPPASPLDDDADHAPGDRAQRMGHALRATSQAPSSPETSGPTRRDRSRRGCLHSDSTTGRLIDVGFATISGDRRLGAR